MLTGASEHHAGINAERRAVRTVAALGFLSRQSREPESANQHAEAPPHTGLWVI